MKLVSSWISDSKLMLLVRDIQPKTNFTAVDQRLQENGFFGCEGKDDAVATILGNILSASYLCLFCVSNWTKGVVSTAEWT